MNNIAENIRNFRTFRGLSQRELADKLNKTSAVISNWEKGINSPDLDSLEKLCKLLDCSPNEMFGWERNRKLEAFLARKEQLVIEMNKLTRAREALDKQIAEYAKQLEEANPVVDMADTPIDLESIPNEMQRRITFIDSSKDS